MEKFKKFITTAIIGGLTILLPIAICLATLGWVFRLITDLIQPLTNLIIAEANIKEIIADLIVIIIIFLSCFFVGLLVRTNFGKFFYGIIESKIFNVAPGYKLIKETILQLLGREKAPFSTVALVNIFENHTMATAFITDEHPDGSYTVFIPTGPNPTSGQIFHLDKKFVHPTDIPVEEAMRSIISCGAGSTKLIQSAKKK